MHLRVSREIVPPDLVERWQTWQERCRRDPAAALYPGEASVLWIPEWLPIAGDGAGGGLFVDLRSGPHRGCVVRFNDTGHEATPEWTDSEAMLTHVANALESLPMDTGGATVIGAWRVPG